MNTFEERYTALNPAQKKAVDTIDGPVMVIAGPGTGKTELLSMRVANILKKSDALPQNILCLTYTESGAHAMRERLVGLIGADAYKVSIHTFHSFGSEIINHNAEYFYHGAHFRPADELSSYEILRSIFEKLPHSNPLASQMNDEYTYLRDTQSAISDLKKSGLTSDELINILDRNDQFIEWLQPQINSVFADRISKKSYPSVTTLLQNIATYTEPELELVTYEPLHELVSSSLNLALEHAMQDDTTKPLSAWKKEWCERDEKGHLTLKDAKRSKRLRSVAAIYYEYLTQMQKRALFDFDDMILRTVHALEVFPDLRLNLQEQYQYVLVDEFQDTNDAQMRLLWNMTNNSASEGRPNIMIVGDDDQAIYRFQGATLSNILDFRDRYQGVEVVTLRDNYRSVGPILTVARSTITQAQERLENAIQDIDKTLTPHLTADYRIDFGLYGNEYDEYAAVAQHIATERAEHPHRKIAVIARHHRQLISMLPFMQDKNISLSYDRRDNVLDSPPVEFLILLARVVTYLSEQRLNEANGLLPQLLSHPAWGLTSGILWQLSVESHKANQFWLEMMLSNDGPLNDIAEWLILSAHLSLHEPLEYIIDHLSGTEETQVADDATDDASEAEDTTPPEGYRSPLRDYFFSHKLLTKHPAVYIAYLDALSSIRLRIRDYRPEGRLLLKDFVDCIDKYRSLGIAIQSSGHITADHEPVELLTAHRAKGLEFDSVYIVSLTDTVWGGTARTRPKLISYPHNLPIGISGDSDDEHIRLLFVALTRAKTSLFLSSHHMSASKKPALPVGYLNHVPTTEQDVTAPELTTQENVWHAGLTTIIDHNMQELLRDTLKTYKLSATHLCNFIDVSRGGPELFLLQNLLRFPQAKNPSAAFGSAVHTTLQRAHTHLSATGKKRPIEDLLGDFEQVLGEYQLASDQYDHFAKKGTDILTRFFEIRYDSFSANQLAEQQFGSEAVTLGEVRLTGAIDLIEIDEEAKTIQVVDYKTGKSTTSWQGKTEYEKIKLHHYRQQLMFYKVLIENSRRFSGYTVTSGVIEYVEPDARGTVNRIELAYDKDSLAEFERLLAGVWQCIQKLHFSTDKVYDQNLTGIQAFEADLIDS